MEPDLFVPGDQQYQMQNQSLEPVGLDPLIEEKPLPSPVFNTTAHNAVINQTLPF